MSPDCFWLATFSFLTLLSATIKIKAKMIQKCICIEATLKGKPANLLLHLHKVEGQIKNIMAKIISYLECPDF